MLFIYVLVLIVVGFASYVHYFTQYSRTGRLINKIPGPRPVPILGNFYLFKDKSQRELVYYE